MVQLFSYNSVSMVTVKDYLYSWNFDRLQGRLPHLTKAVPVDGLLQKCETPSWQKGWMLL